MASTDTQLAQIKTEWTDQAKLDRQFELRLERTSLDITRREIAVIIQANLADGDHLRARSKPAELFKPVCGRRTAISGVDTDGGEYGGLSGCDIQTLGARLEAEAGG